MNPTIKNIEILTDNQRKYVLMHSKGMAALGWKQVSISWYSNGDRAMIVEDINGTIYPSTPIPSDNELSILFAL